MATFKTSIGYQRKDGTYNIRIRVTHNRKVMYIPTAIYVEKSDLKKSGEIKSQHFIDMCSDIIREYRKICNECGSRLLDIDISDLIKILKNKTDLSREFSLDFIIYLRNKKEELLKENRIGMAELYATVANSLCRFMQKENLDVNQITTRFLEKYIDFLKNEPAQKGKKKDGATGTRKCTSYPGIIRKALNDLRREYNDEDLAIQNIMVNPFARIKLPRRSIPLKRSITVEQFKKIQSLPKRESSRRHKGQFDRFDFSLDLFVLSFCLIGMNSADLYTCTDYSDEIITYERLKTRSRRQDKAIFSIRVEPEIEYLLEKYRNRDSSRPEVFCFYQYYSSFDNLNQAINKGLKEVGKAVGIEGLTYYAARHSWATIARNELGIDKYLIHEALNHVDSDMRITDTYIKRDFRPIWEANKKVLSLFHFGTAV